MKNVRAKFAALAVAAVVAAAHTMGCGCGVAAAPGPHDQNGTVTFDAVALGSSQQLSIPFQDSADVDETITGATVEGADAAAFEVVSTFPIAVPAGEQASVVIRFAPTHTGDSQATLVLQTANMGPSPVPLDGTGVPAGA